MLLAQECRSDTRVGLLRKMGKLNGVLDGNTESLSGGERSGKAEMIVTRNRLHPVGHIGCGVAIAGRIAPERIAFADMHGNHRNRSAR